jgi:hypothetical protein
MLSRSQQHDSAIALIVSAGERLALIQANATEAEHSLALAKAALSRSQQHDGVVALIVSAGERLAAASAKKKRRKSNFDGGGAFADEMPPDVNGENVNSENVNSENVNDENINDENVNDENVNGENNDILATYRGMTAVQLKYAFKDPNTIKQVVGHLPTVSNPNTIVVPLLSLVADKGLLSTGGLTIPQLNAFRRYFGFAGAAKRSDIVAFLESKLE